MKTVNYDISQFHMIHTSSEHYYLYDGLTNKIMTIGRKLVRESEKETGQAVFSYLKEQRLLPEQKEIKVIWQYDFEKHMQVIESEVRTLLLQITRRCNLRCDYCVYSGKYTHMTPHEENSMTWETIKNSIDFFAIHNRDCKAAEIDFYGGEAFLCLDKMQEAVKYAKKVFSDKPLLFRVTTNGVLLRGKVLQWLADTPEMQVTITVNGPYHDQFRKTLNGGGSLKLILDNLEVIKQKYPKVWERQIHFLANIAHPQDLEAMKEFYNDVIGKAPGYISNIRSLDGNQEIGELLGTDSRDIQDAHFRELYTKAPEPFLEAYYGQGIQAVHNRRIYTDGTVKHIGSCMPGLEKLFVHWDGRFGICETACDKAIIGSLEKGFDREKLRKLYQKTENLYQKNCSKCWAQRLCTVCFKDSLNPDGSVAERLPDGFCKASRHYAENQLRTYCEIAERFPERLKQYEVLESLYR